MDPKRESTERWERRKSRRESFKRLEAAKSLLSLGESSYTEPMVPVEEQDKQEENGIATQIDI